MRLRAYVKYGAHDDIYQLFELHAAGMLAARPNLDVNFAGTVHIVTDSRGFRSPELTDPRAPRSLRLAFLGGSTTFCAQAPANEATWPAKLTERLDRALPNLSVEHANAGVTGASVADSTLAVSARLATIDPDVIVIVHAAKDLADDTRALAIEGGVFTAPQRDWLERRSKLWKLLRKNLRYRASQAQASGAGAKLQFDPELLAAEFEARLHALVEEAQAVADVVALATFAIKTRADQDLETQRANLEQAFSFTPYLTPASILAGYAAYNAAIARVAAATGAVLIDGHEDLAGTDELFHDSVHFTEAGYEAMAARCEARLSAAPSFQALVARLEQRE